MRREREAKKKINLDGREAPKERQEAEKEAEKEAEPHFVSISPRSGQSGKFKSTLKAKNNPIITIRN